MFGRKFKFRCFAKPESANAFGAANAVARRFAAARDGAAAVEFAWASTALFIFLLAIINLGYLGLTLGALQHGVQAAARQAAVTAAANLSGNGSTTACPLGDAVRQVFNDFSSPPLPAASGSITDGTPVLYATTSFSPLAQTVVTGTISPWVSNSANMPPGTFIVLTSKFKWKPIGFSSFPKGIPLSVTAAAFVLGTGVSTTC